MWLRIGCWRCLRRRKNKDTRDKAQGIRKAQGTRHKAQEEPRSKIQKEEQRRRKKQDTINPDNSRRCGTIGGRLDKRIRFRNTYYLNYAWR